MNKILINGISAKSGGGRSILTNLLNTISSRKINFEFIVIVPQNHGYEKFSTENIAIVEFSTLHYNVLKQLYFYNFWIKKFIKENNISLVFNLADVIIPLNRKQLFLFDWSYATYPESIVWKRMGLFERYYKKFKLHLFKKRVKYLSVLYAQTNSIKSRLNEFFQIENIGIIPNAVSIDNLSGGVFKDFNLPKNRINFLCLSKYYIHKNIESFIPLAKIIKKEDLPFTIILTINQDQHKNAKLLIDQIEKENLQDILINVDEVEMQNVPSLYDQTDALLLPTLLESFSGTYIEAMYHKKPIFTSNYDFAIDVCGDSAIYFDPLNTLDILKAMKQIQDEALVREKVLMATERLNEFPSWKQVSDIIINEFQKYV